ncbi:MAG: hypothetical protein AAFP69_22985, partial [Planctomycetota bacterium]
MKRNLRGTVCGAVAALLLGFVGTVGDASDAAAVITPGEAQEAEASPSSVPAKTAEYQSDQRGDHNPLGSGLISQASCSTAVGGAACGCELPPMHMVSCDSGCDVGCSDACGESSCDSEF